MNSPELEAALGPVLEALRSLGIRHYVGGSIASSAHGIARASADADVIAELGSGQVEPLARALSGAYYVPEERMRDAALRRASFNLIHLATMLKVDVFVSKGRPFDARAMERASPGPNAGAAGPVPVASAEDTVLAKLEWFRRGGETSERQWGDVLGVLRVGGPVLDRAYLEEFARQLGVADLLARALAEAGDAT
jgi:hypothetical protein